MIFAIIILIMHQNSNDFQQLEETDFPAFPVVFQPELEESNPHSNNLNIKSRQIKGPFKLPDKQIMELQRLITKVHDTSYPQLFQQTWQNGLHNIQNFFNIYRPLNINFVQQMKSYSDKLKIVRLSSHKLYVGQFKEGQCNGRSIVVFKNGNIYEGMMTNNKREGKGFYLQAGAGWFQGTFINDLKSQSGVEVVSGKWAYQGTFVNGLRHDKGLYAQKNGLVYNGQWKLGIMHGKGILKSTTSSYSGMIVNSLKHGQGQQRFTNGDSYKGQYQNNRFDGFGTYAWKQGQATYEGSFKNGLRHGKGKWSSGQTKYSGSYIEGLKEGYGQLYFPSGNFYKGNFIEDKRQGYGEMFWTDGSFYKGDWKGGVQNGKGQIYLVGGEIISGLFQNSILVQITPSIYQKQMEISSMGIQDLFGSNAKLQTTNKTRTFSQSKNITHAKKKLAKIDENEKKKGAIKDHIYFKTPEKSQGNTHKFHNPHSTTAYVGTSLRAPNINRNQAMNSQSHGHGHAHGHSHHHGNSSQGRQCKCMRRLQNFRLRQRMKTKINQSKVEQTFHQDN